MISSLSLKVMIRKCIEKVFGGRSVASEIISFTGGDMGSQMKTDILAQQCIPMNTDSIRDDSDLE